MTIPLLRRSLSSSRDQSKQNVSAERPKLEKSMGHTFTPSCPGEGGGGFLIGFTEYVPLKRVWSTGS